MNRHEEQREHGSLIYPRRGRRRIQEKQQGSGNPHEHVIKSPTANKLWYTSDDDSYPRTLQRSASSDRNLNLGMLQRGAYRQRHRSRRRSSSADAAAEGSESDGGQSLTSWNSESRSRVASLDRLP